MAHDGLKRMTDANANRACEGLRVLEDVARFVLDDAALSKALKDLRHGVRHATRAVSGASRDTEGDVGTSISGAMEHERSGGTRAIVAANARRVQEALRVLEEGAKALGLDAPLLERARYGVYTIERDLLTALGDACPQWRLCVLVTRSLCTHLSAEEVVRLAALGGAGCVQIREKSMGDGELFASARSLVDIAHEHGVHAVVNDRADVAVACGADGVHVGRGDASIADVRRVVGDGVWVGATCDSVERVTRAAREGADCVGVGPVFVSGTKPKDALGGVGLASACAEEARRVGVSVLAISGITSENVGALAAAGVPGVAVCGAVCGSADPRGACERILDAMNTASQSAGVG